MKFFNKSQELEITQVPDKENGFDTDPIKLKYPRAVFAILIVEFCERFSYYGMRAVLTIYLRNILGFDENESTSFYHVYLFLCYGTPILGGILADSFLGKYRTILYISILYACGNLILSLASVTPLHPYLPVVFTSFLGLFLIGVGTGGIKPCVIALGAEQFTLPQQEKKQKQFFSIFMFIVSIGSMLSTLITPVFRKDVKCFGGECYPLAFGFPASLMLLAILVFVLGKPLYRILKPTMNITVEVSKCLWFGFINKMMSIGQSKNGNVHWLDLAKDHCSLEVIRDTKGLTRLLPYFLPVPLFWALYEQLGSRWTLQATRMDGTLWKDGYVIKPDQFQVLNAVLMFALIPTFEGIIYPLFEKINLLKRPLQRMVVGCALAGVAFVLAGLVEKHIEPSYAILPRHNDIHMNLINTLECPINIHFDPEKNDALHQIAGHGENFVLRTTKSFKSFTIFPGNCPTHTHNDLSKNNHKNENTTSIRNATSAGKGTGNSIDLLETDVGKVQSVFIVKTGDLNLAIVRVPLEDDVKKSKLGDAKLRILGIRASNSTKNGVFDDSLVVKLINVADSSRIITFPANNSGEIFFSKTLEIEPASYQVILLSNLSNFEKILSNSTEFNPGGSYQLVLFTNPGKSEDLLSKLPYDYSLVTLTPSNTVHMLWLLPQYIVMVFAEILFIISGLEYAYTEAPESMRSLIQSVWHLMNAMGNLIVIIVAEMDLNHSQATEFFAFSVAMGVDVIIFAYLAYRYKYVSNQEVFTILPHHHHEHKDPQNPEKNLEEKEDQNANEFELKELDQKISKN